MLKNQYSPIDVTESAQSLNFDFSVPDCEIFGLFKSIIGEGIFPSSMSSP